MKEYIGKEFKNPNILVSENIMFSLTDSKLCDLVLGLLMKIAQSIYFKRRLIK